MMKPLYLLTLEEAIDGLEKGSFTSTELTRACLDHIEKLDPQINCFVRVDPEVAMAQAKASDDRRANQVPQSLIDGVPYNLKDVYATKDSPTSASSHMLEGWWAPYNATVYQKLCNAGAVLLGKTNTDEFTMGSSTETSYFGVSRNPWDFERVSGGSSGGPAASIAAHFGMFSIGTDTGGSIRQPAAFCGVTGLRPTYGRISRFGEIAMASSLDQTGPICKTARDAAIVLHVLAGVDHLDATSSPEPVPDYLAEINKFIKKDKSKPLKGLKIGIAKEYFGEGIDLECEKVVRDAIKQMEDLGAVTKDVSLPSLRYALAVYYVLCPAEVSSNMARYDGIRFGYSIERDEDKNTKKLPDLYNVYAQSRVEGLGSEVKRRIILGTHVLSSGYYDAYYKKAEKVRAVVAAEFAKVLQEVDLLMAPCTPGIAFKIGEKINNPLTLYKEDVMTVPLNIAGIPGMSIPCGYVRNMPVGLQIMSARFKEDLLLNVGSAYQCVTNWHNKYPECINNGMKGSKDE